MTTTPSPHFLNPDTMSKPFGYTQVVRVSGGQTIYISGQIALDPAGQVVGPGDLHAQTVQVFKNLDAALAAVGATFQHVVKLSYYMLDISQIPVVRSVRDQYVNTQQPPASTAVEVRRLFRDDFLIEVEAVAVIP
ncbi:MAG: RidA family protein [Roseiflexaceae bacterium]